MYKEGDKVILMTNDIGEDEDISWSLDQGLVVGDTYILGKSWHSDHESNLVKWVVISANGKRYQHPASKFKLYQKKTRAHLPGWF